jgi:hypothetical protein
MSNQQPAWDAAIEGTIQAAIMGISSVNQGGATPSSFAFLAHERKVKTYLSKIIDLKVVVTTIDIASELDIPEHTVIAILEKMGLELTDDEWDKP